MLDPISAITLATSAYKGIKKACEVGKEISSFTGAISQFAKASADIDFLEQKSKKPPLYKMFSDTQSNALEIWTQREAIDNLINGIIITVICSIGIAIAAGVIYFVGKQQGKW